jgi:hypothetical protein
MEVLGSFGNQFQAIIRRIGNLPRASKVLPNRVEVVELTGIPGGIRTLVCAVKGCSQIVTVSIADGGYSWISIQEKNPFNPELNLQDAFFQAAQQAPQRLAIGTAFNGFNDTLATWVQTASSIRTAARLGFKASLKLASFIPAAIN